MKWRMVLSVGGALLVGYLAGRRSSGHSGRASDLFVSGSASEAAAAPPTNGLAGGSSHGSGPLELDPAHLEIRLRAIRSLGDRKRTVAASELAKEVPLRYAQEALRLGDAILDQENYSPFSDELLKRWSEMDPKAVIAFGMAPPHSQRSEQVVQWGAEEWARQDPSAALSWATERTASENRDDLLRAVIVATAEADPQRALKSVQLLPSLQRASVKEDILVQLARKAPEEALEEAAKESHQGSAYQQSAESRILTLWMSQDPEASGRWLLANGDGKGHRGPVLLAMLSLTQAHPEKALKLAENLSDGFRRNRMIGQILEQCEDLDTVKSWTEAQTDPKSKAMGQLAYLRVLSKTDPATAAASLASLPVNDLSGTIASQVFAQYSAVAGAASTRLAATIQDPDLRKQALLAAIGGWGETDPAAAANFAATLPANHQRTEALQNLAGTWAAQDPNAFIDWLKKGADSTFSKGMVADLLIASAYSAPAQAAELAVSVHATASQLSQIAGKWSQNDPEAALAWAATLPEGKSRDEILSQTLSSNMDIDPDQTLELARKIGLAALPSAATEALVSNLAQNDLGEAQRFVEELPEGESRDKALESFMRAWGPKNPEEAIAYAQKLPEGSTARNEGLAAALGSLAARDADAAFAQLGQIGPDAWAQAASQAISSVAEYDPAKVWGWISGLPDGAAKQNAGEQLTTAWVSNDPIGASEWLKTLPAGEFHDAMGRTFALQAAQADPQLAWSWALAFPNLQDSSSPLATVAGQWLQEDPSAATAAIRTSGLPQEVIDELLKK